VLGFSPAVETEEQVAMEKESIHLKLSPSCSSARGSEHDMAEQS